MAIWGSDDPVIPSVHAETFRSVAEPAKVAIFERAGHFPHKDRPEQFVTSSRTSSPATAPATFSQGSLASQAPRRRPSRRSWSAQDPRVVTIA